MRNKIVSIIIVVVIVSVGSFYAGSKYRQSAVQSTRNSATVARFGQGFAMNGSGVSRGASSGGSVSGQVLSKDDVSITVKLNDGGSKLVFLSTSTPVTRNAEGAISDILVGTSVMVFGSSNSDGSITAQSVQIRPTVKIK